MNDFLTALILATVIEGMVYALFPDAMKRMMAQVLALPTSRLRVGGLVAAAAGIVVLWLIRRA